MVVSHVKRGSSIPQVLSLKMSGQEMRVKDTDPVDPDQLELVQQLNNSTTGGVPTRRTSGLMGGGGGGGELLHVEEKHMADMQQATHTSQKSQLILTRLRETSTAFQHLHSHSATQPADTDNQTWLLFLPSRGSV